VPVPYLEHRMAEELFRHHVLRLLKAQGLLSDDRIELLRSWKSTGFNTDDSVRIPAGERRTLEHVARYMLRSPVSLSRMQWTPGSPHVFYAPKSSHHAPSELFPPLEKIDALEFLARVITQIPEPARTPTLIQNGEKDARVPIPNAYELYQGLKDKNVPVRLAVYKGFGHGIDKPRSNRAVMTHNEEWFSKWI
jgi:pimeloyl-ACP methyl ester carboxylesterase